MVKSRNNRNTFSSQHPPHLLRFIFTSFVPSHAGCGKNKMGECGCGHVMKHMMSAALYSSHCISAHAWGPSDRIQPPKSSNMSLSHRLNYFRNYSTTASLMGLILARNRSILEPSWTGSVWHGGSSCFPFPEAIPAELLTVCCQKYSMQRQCRILTLTFVLYI